MGVLHLNLMTSHIPKDRGDISNFILLHAEEWAFVKISESWSLGAARVLKGRGGTNAAALGQRPEAAGGDARVLDRRS